MKPPPDRNVAHPLQPADPAPVTIRDAHSTDVTARHGFSIVGVHHEQGQLDRRRVDAAVMEKLL